MFAAMKKYNEELKKSGILVSVGGLHPSSKGIRITYPVPGEPPIPLKGAIIHEGLSFLYVELY
ncbi:hypothetical protein GCM10008967_38470 [Bacillus carboniphilus]|uniref:Uncharacterized protein n=1 Tax=Bacillus carboniphilus TaxID=86663 RepID=A0ABN0WQR8_9BACI